MTKQYKIEGMTCMGCRAHVEKSLQKLDGVTNAHVDLQKDMAVVEMREEIPLEKLQEALSEAGGNYKIFKFENR